MSTRTRKSARSQGNVVRSKTRRGRKKADVEDADAQSESSVEAPLVPLEGGKESDDMEEQNADSNTGENRESGDYSFQNNDTGGSCTNETCASDEDMDQEKQDSSGINFAIAKNRQRNNTSETDMSVDSTSENNHGKDDTVVTSLEKDDNKHKETEITESSNEKLMVENSIVSAGNVDSASAKVVHETNVNRGGVDPVNFIVDESDDCNGVNESLGVFTSKEGVKCAGEDLMDMNAEGTDKQSEHVLKDDATEHVNITVNNKDAQQEPSDSKDSVAAVDSKSDIFNDGDAEFDAIVLDSTDGDVMDTENVSCETTSDNKNDVAAIHMSDSKVIAKDLEKPIPEDINSESSKERIREDVGHADTKQHVNEESNSENDKLKAGDGSSEIVCGESEDAEQENECGSELKEKAKKKMKYPSELEKFWKPVKDDPADFTGWTYLLQYVDQECDLEAGREAYSAFLKLYPYCYGYWKKYSDLEKKKGTKEKCEEVFEKGLKAIPLSVDLWIYYMTYYRGQNSNLENGEDLIREQFERAVNTCGMEFRSDRLWEAYIKWETEGNRSKRVVALFDRLLHIPTQSYKSHFQSLENFIRGENPKGLMSVDDFLAMRKEVLEEMKSSSAKESDEEVGEEAEEDGDVAPPGLDVPPPGQEEDAPSLRPDEEMKAMQERLVEARRPIYAANEVEVSKRWAFEDAIKRPYFHIKPLERGQLKNWKDYIDFEISEGKNDRVIVLFERCLIACALYEEYWLKYIKYLECLPCPNTEAIRDVYRRACTSHLPSKPNINLLWATYEEKTGHVREAAEILSNLESRHPDLVELAYRRINLERRHGNLDGAEELYRHYISRTSNKEIAMALAIKFVRFLYKVRKDSSKARDVLEAAIAQDKDNPMLYMQMVDVDFQQDVVNVDDICATFDKALASNLPDKTKMKFAQRKVEFLEDFGSNIDSLQKAQEEFYLHLKALRLSKKDGKERKAGDKRPPEKDIKVIESQPREKRHRPGTGTTSSTKPSTTTTTQSSSSGTPTHTSSESSGNYQYYGNQQPYGQQNYGQYQGWGDYGNQGGYNYNQQNWNSYYQQPHGPGYQPYYPSSNYKY